MSTTIPKGALQLFDEPNFGHLATVMADGTPQVSPAWIERDGDTAVVVNTAKGRVKHRNLQRDPHVALAVHDPRNPYRYVQVRGRAELVEEGADDMIDRLAKKYLGKDTYPFRQPGEERITVRIIPESVNFTDA
jgi:PPOX class probable F420-dependent enzyme